MKIAAVVVTFNRLNLLKQCINSIRNQTKKVDEIIVINNGSTDGTLEWLNEQKDLTTITQENLGGAGGFYTGIKTAFEKGYDWIWCMDDDCLPALDCLKKQNLFDKNILTNPRIVNEKGFDVHDYCLYKKNKFYHKIYDYLSIPYKNLFFVGLLISNIVIEKIGLPIKEFFIYGDDTEYTYRAQKYGFKLKVVYDALIIHPSIKPLYEFEDKKLFFYFRNLAYTFKLYDFLYIRLLKLIFLGIKMSFIYKKNMINILRAIYFGLKNKLG